MVYQRRCAGVERTRRHATRHVEQMFETVRDRRYGLATHRSRAATRPTASDATREDGRVNRRPHPRTGPRQPAGDQPEPTSTDAGPGPAAGARPEPEHDR